MSKKKQQVNTGEDLYGQTAGGIGALAVVFAILGAIKDKLGLSWPVTVLLTVGVLVLIGYTAWKVRSFVKARWAGGKPPAAAVQAAALQQEAPATAVIGGDQAAAQAAAVHPELTRALATAGAIAKDEIVRADQVTIGAVPAPGKGTVYDFLTPEGRTYKDVEKRLGNVAGMFGRTRMHTTMERVRDNERRVRLLVLKEPPHTRPFAAPTRQEIETFAGVPFGHDVDRTAGRCDDLRQGITAGRRHGADRKDHADQRSDHLPADRLRRVRPVSARREILRADAVREGRRPLRGVRRSGRVRGHGRGTERPRRAPLRKS